MKWTIVSKGDLSALRTEVESLKKQRLEADIASDVRFRGMQNLFACERKLLEEKLEDWRVGVTAQCDRERTHVDNTIANLQNQVRLAQEAMNRQMRSAGDQLEQQLGVLLVSLKQETNDLHDQMDKERAIFNQNVLDWRTAAKSQFDREAIAATMHFASWKQALETDLEALHRQVDREVSKIQAQMQIELKATSDRAKLEQEALKTRLLGSLKAITPIDNLKDGCAHEWPEDWILSDDAKHESQQCILCDLWRIRFSAMWCQHHDQDRGELRYSVVKSL